MKTNLILISTFLGLFAGKGHAQVTRTAVTGENFVADFYHQKAAERLPGILFFGGSEGGRPDRHLPEFFAENGYPVLAVAYFKEKGLSETLQMIPLEYFDKAIAWMEQRKDIPQGGIVVVGVSKGAELALLLASTKPEIKGVISLSPSSVVWDGLPKAFWPPNPRSSWSVNGKPVPFVPYDFSKEFAAGDPLAIYKFYQQSLTQKPAVAKAAIKVEQIRGPVLLASGDHDQLWPAADMGDAICARLKEKGFQHKYEHLKYKNAGHTMNEYFMIGGTPEGNKLARLDLADRMLAFLKPLNETAPIKSKASKPD